MRYFVIKYCNYLRKSYTQSSMMYLEEQIGFMYIKEAKQ